MWRIYYDDGSTWDWTQGLEGREPYGVICILHKIATQNGSTLHINYGAPYYGYDGSEWILMQLNDVEDRLAHGLPIEKFILGRALSRGDFMKIYRQAQSDKDAENLP